MNLHTKLTENQINTFYQKGWLGPLDTFSISELEPVKKEIDTISQIEMVDGRPIKKFRNSYLGIQTNLNHHLYCKSLSRLFEDQRIVSRLNQLGEPDLLLWRTYIFHRMPGQDAVGWHQAIDYYGYDADETKVELIFPEGEKPLNLTVWIAFEDVTPEMGTIEFANGSHHTRCKTLKVPLGQGALKEEKYHRNIAVEPQEKQYSKVFDFDENNWELESVPTIKAGQTLIFTEQVMHRGLPNNSDRERLAINGRYIRPSVTVYPRRLTSDYIDNYGFDIRKHFCILVSGIDSHNINKVVTNEM